ACPQKRAAGSCRRVGLVSCVQRFRHRPVALSDSHRATAAYAAIICSGRAGTGRGHTMKRWLPHPLLAAMLLLAWLLLQQSLAPGSIVLGGVLAIVLCRLLARLAPPPVRLHAVTTLLRLMLRVGG